MIGTEVDVDALHGRAYGDENGPLVLGIPGLTGSSISLGVVGEALASAGRRFVALDPRGRGGTPPGDLGGLSSHVRDVLAVAATLGVGRVDLVGHSMGAFVAIRAAAEHPDRIGRIALLDAAGVPEPDALVPIGAARDRLGLSFASADAFVDAIRASGVVDPWSDAWETIYRHSLTDDHHGGVKVAVDPDAVGADAESILGEDPRAFWASLRGPALLIRATRPLGAEGGGILSAADAAAFARSVPGAELVEVDAGHYTVATDPATLAAVTRFLAP